MARTYPSTATRRDALLEAALRCFSRGGYDATTIEDIVNESGASTGSLYYHFDDKQGIAAALYEHALIDYQTTATEVVQNARSTEDAVRDGVVHYLAWVQEHSDLARFLLSGRHADAPAQANAAVHDLRAAFFARLSEWLAEAQARGELRELSDRAAIALWNGPAQQLARDWLTRPAGRSLAEEAEAVAEGAWRALRP